MFFIKTKMLSYFVIILGILLIIYGLWQYYGVQTFYSEFSETASAVKRIIFPVIGVSLILIGYLFSRFVRDVQEEIHLLRTEISNELKKLKNSK
jgi:uncharacterized membrane protein YidH (DUF202 family)